MFLFYYLRVTYLCNHTINYANYAFFFYISVQFANYLMSVVFGTQVTYIIFFDFSGEKRDVEHIRSLGYIAGASIFIDDFNTVILLFIHIVFYTGYG